MAAAHQRQGGKEARHFGKLVEEAVFRPEKDGRTQDHRLGKRFAHALLAFRLGHGIAGIRFQVGADGGDMHQCTDAGAGGAVCDVGGALGLHILESLAFLEQDAGQVDDGLRAHHGVGDGFRVGDVAFDEIDLAHGAQWAQEEGAIGMAGCHLDTPAGAGQRPDRVTAQET